jgi:tetratricopeptide (TPR) repeat protein
MRSRRVLAPAFALLLIAPRARTQEPAHHDDAPGARAGARLGTVHFPSSGAPAAQPRFLRGLALLHSFEYDDARAAFREAERADDGFAMAYWGEALTFAQLLWGLDDSDSARATLLRLGPTRDARLARAGTPRERAYGAAVEALFDTTSETARVQGYVAGLRRVAGDYPSDLEARALLAVALLMDESGTAAERTARTEETIGLAERVFAEQPDHPGGAHYLIHATDDPKYAARGLAAARAYAKIAPDAEHALHMPSHIFLQVGAWDDVVASNERAWAASRKEVASHALPPTELSFHVLAWLQYGYLEQGRYAAARALIDSAERVLHGVDWATSDAIDARYALAEMRFAYARETGDWSFYGGRAPTPLPAGRAGTSARERLFAMADAYRVAFLAATFGDTVRAKAAAAALPERAVTARTQIGALVAKSRGDTAAWVAQLRAATDEEAKAAHLGPPKVYPSSDLLGSALLELGRPAEAIAAYERSLALMPNRTLSLLGLARAHRAAGHSQEAARTRALVRANWHDADRQVKARVATAE